MVTWSVKRSPSNFLSRQLTSQTCSLSGIQKTRELEGMESLGTLKELQLHTYQVIEIRHTEHRHTDRRTPWDCPHNNCKWQSRSLKCNVIKGDTLWWQGFSAGYLDFTNEKAAQWWTDRLNRLRYNSSFIALILGTNESLCLLFT